MCKIQEMSALVCKELNKSRYVWDSETPLPPSKDDEVNQHHEPLDKILETPPK